jgi:hypothetical protein
MTQVPGQAADVFKICGDVSDPAEAHYRTGRRGVAADYRLHKNVLGKPVIRYNDNFLTADVFPKAGSLEVGFVILYCPVCATEGRHNTLRITPDNKTIHYDRERPPKFAGITMSTLVKSLFADAPGGPPEGSEQELLQYLGGTISISAFRCSWEGGTGTGSPVCRWKVKIDNNVARDA